MITVLLIVHLFVTIALIGVVLIQRSEGGGLGIGGSQGMGSFMSGRGTANLLTRTTAILATLFMGLSLALALLNRGTSGVGGHSILDLSGPAPISAPAPAGGRLPAGPGGPAPGTQTPGAPAPAMPNPGAPASGTPAPGAPAAAGTTAPAPAAGAPASGAGVPAPATPAAPPAPTGPSIPTK